MSQYISFHIKTRTGDFLPIACFSRSNIYYEFAYNYVPSYKEETPFTRTTLNYILADIKEEKEKEEKYLKQYNDKLLLISGMNNSLEEKMEYINSTNESIEYTQERISDLNDCYMFYCTLGYILDEADNTKWYSNKSRCLNPDDYIYAGIECSLPGQQDEEE